MKKSLFLFVIIASLCLFFLCCSISDVSRENCRFIADTFHSISNIFCDYLATRAQIDSLSSHEIDSLTYAMLLNNLYATRQELVASNYYLRKTFPDHPVAMSLGSSVFKIDSLIIEIKNKYSEF